MQRSHSMRGTRIGFGRRLSAMRRGTARAARRSRPERRGGGRSGWARRATDHLREEGGPPARAPRRPGVGVVLPHSPLRRLRGRLAPPAQPTQVSPSRAAHSPGVALPGRSPGAAHSGRCPPERPTLSEPMQNNQEHFFSDIF